MKNTVSPALPSLPRADRDAMDDYAENMRTLVGVLGHRILEPKIASTNPAVVRAPELGVGQVRIDVVRLPSGDSQNQFSLKVAGLAANALRTDEGIVVLTGSYISASPQPSLSGGYLSKRETLITQGIVVPVPGQPYLVFAKDYVFSSPSQAAAVIVGYAINGREAWKTPSGQSWRSVEEESFSGTA